MRSGLAVVTPAAAVEASPWLPTIISARLPLHAVSPVAAGSAGQGAVLAAAAGVGPGAREAAAGGGGALAWGGGLATCRHRSALADRGPRPAVRDASSASSRLPSLVTACGDAKTYDFGQPSRMFHSNAPSASSRLPSLVTACNGARRSLMTVGHIVP